MRRAIVAGVFASLVAGSLLGAPIANAAGSSGATPKKPPTWQTFKANRVAEAAPNRLMIPKLLPAVIDDARDTFEEWREAWGNHLRYEREERQASAQGAEPSDASYSPEVHYATGPYAIPTYIVMCESGGNYLAENDYSTASGAYQIIDGTWAGYGGYYHAADAPPSVQDAKAAELWAGGAGASHWAQCL